MSPVRVGSLMLRNRITRSAHGTGYLVDGEVTEKLIAYHEARARGGVGSLFLSAMAGPYLHWTTESPLPPGNKDVPVGIERLVERMHSHDTKVFSQLCHTGPLSTTMDGTPAWAPSVIAEPKFGHVPLAMTQAMIDEIVEAFADAARKLHQAGLDGLEIHGAHSYLVAAFLSPATNLREDDYGGNTENRARFACELLTAMRAATSPDFALGIRYSCSEFVPGGVEPQEAIRIRRALEDNSPIDMVNLSMGSYYDIGKAVGAMHEPHGYQIPTTGQVAGESKIPTIVTGRILTLAEAEQVLRSGAGDIVSMVRAMLADPELVAKSLAGRESEVRPCIGCNDSCIGRTETSQATVSLPLSVGCTVNPEAGNEHLGKAASSSRSRSVLVVGAGPAGLQAARTAALRGHRVVLHEADDAPGGLVRFSRAAPFREEIGRVCDWLWQELDRLGVEPRLGSRVDAALVEREGADVVIVATGSEPRRDGNQRLRPVHRIEGIDLPHVLTPLDVLAGSLAPAKRAVVFDDLGTYDAVGAAERLLADGTEELVFATSFEIFAPDLYRTMQRDAAMRRLSAYAGFQLKTKIAIERVGTDSVVLSRIGGGPELLAEADAVVMATGFTSRAALFDELQGTGIETHLIGDALAPLKMPHAISSGHAAGAAV